MHRAPSPPPDPRRVAQATRTVCPLCASRCTACIVLLPLLRLPGGGCVPVGGKNVTVLPPPPPPHLLRLRSSRVHGSYKMVRDFLCTPALACSACSACTRVKAPGLAWAPVCPLRVFPLPRAPRVNSCTPPALLPRWCLSLFPVPPLLVAIHGLMCARPLPHPATHCIADGLP